MSQPEQTTTFDLDAAAFRAHEGGKLEVRATKPLRDRDDLSLLYTPGVADVCLAIAEDPSLSRRFTARNNTVAVVSDGTAVLGLGDIGPLGAMPVMEGKAVLFKHFGGVDAIPVTLESGSVDELVEAVVRLAPSFGGINLEDISAPRCFDIERRLRERLDDPLKRWKLSPIDLAAREKYDDYTKAREAMLKATHTDHAPWTIVDFNDQRRGRLTLVRDLLSRIPDTHAEPEAIDFPELGRKPAKEKYKVLKPIANWEGS